MPDSAVTVRTARSLRLLALSPMFILFVTGTRLLIIANYDPVTASGIIQSAGATGTLLGTITPLIPYLFPLMLLAQLAVILIYRNWLVICAVILGCLAVAPAYSTIPAAFNATLDMFRTAGEYAAMSGMFSFLWHDNRGGMIYGSIVVLVVAIETLAWLNRPGVIGGGMEPEPQESLDDEHERESAGGWIWLFGALFVLLGVAILFSCSLGIFKFVETIYRTPFSGGSVSHAVERPWMPAEDLALKSGGHRVAYVLGVKDGWFAILNDRDRSLEYVRSSDVESRTPCRLADDLGRDRGPVISLSDRRQAVIKLCP